MKTLGVLLLAYGLSLCGAMGQATVYTPLSSWADASGNSLALWNRMRIDLLDGPVAGARRPVLPGVNGRNLELLQDSIARRYQHVTGGKRLTEARKLLADASSAERIPKWRGYMAEAIFLDKNENWAYVAKPNASQHDVYAKTASGGPGIQTGQVKFHMDGNAKTYVADMRSDYRSKYFFIPDDHVDSVRSQLRADADALRAGGRSDEAASRYRDMNRVRGIGATSKEIDRATRSAIKEARFVRVAPYMLLGVATVLTVGPTAWDWYQGKIPCDKAVHQLTKSGTIILAGVAADQALVRFKDGLYRGSLKGNVIVASVVLLLDTSWCVYEHGGVSTAAQDPEFWVEFWGSLSATALGLAGGTYGAIGGAALFSETGPGAIVASIVGGVVVGGACAIVGYFGGSEGTRWAISHFCPEVFHKQEAVFAQNVAKDIQDRILTLQQMN
jgi:hypothetical protein